MNNMMFIIQLIILNINIMSTDLKTLKGKIETAAFIGNKTEPHYISKELHLTSFYGGKERGKSLQLGFETLTKEYAHIQLDNDTVKELIEILQENFNK